MSGWDGIDEFVAVAETGGFSSAAERLRVSSSRVSRQVARLEDRLKARLFYRTTRRVALTEAGRLLLERFRGLAEDRDEALRAVGERDDVPRGLLRMTCPTAYGDLFIVPLVNDFLERHSELRVEMTLSNHMLDLVRDGVDLAIRLGRMADSGQVATRVAPRILHLCASPAYLARRGSPLSLGDLANHDCVIGTSDVWTFDDRRETSGADWHFRPRGRFRCNSGHAVLDAALRGFGLCQLPDYYVREPIREGRLVSLLPDHRPPNTEVWAVYPQAGHVPAKVRMMIRHLRQGLANRPEYR
ncbi:MAG: LysR family transcriptional regulator [Rhodospirillum sp.]|nr:LysR family transcriptional regulator [Rhodospirillum sp.]MCF8487675.1 LysR family transcriptional regulator [Rhodospirillum sp.]MCF8499571.1 LysR family transcriptional regulator [Rhodospirillum sp.]